MVTLPLTTPVTTPAVFTVAKAVLLLLQVPPVIESNKLIVLPTQTAFEPVIALTVGNGFTVTERVRTTVPHELITV